MNEKFQSSANYSLGPWSCDPETKQVRYNDTPILLRQDILYLIFSALINAFPKRMSEHDLHELMPATPRKSTLTSFESILGKLNKDIRASTGAGFLRLTQGHSILNGLSLSLSAYQEELEKRETNAEFEALKIGDATLTRDPMHKYVWLNDEPLYAITASTYEAITYLFHLRDHLDKGQTLEATASFMGVSQTYIPARMETLAKRIEEQTGFAVDFLSIIEKATPTGIQDWQRAINRNPR